MEVGDGVAREKYDAKKARATGCFRDVYLSGVSFLSTMLCRAVYDVFGKLREKGHSKRLLRAHLSGLFWSLMMSSAHELQLARILASLGLWGSCQGGIDTVLLYDALFQRWP